MRLHNPPNINLPPLKIEKSQSRTAMEQSPRVSSFIASKLLLEKEFYDFFMELYKKSGEITKILDDMKDRAIPVRLTSLTLKTLRTFNEEDYLLARKYMRAQLTGRRISKNVKKTAEKILLNVLSQETRRMINRVKTRSSNIQNRLSKYEQRQKTTLDILTSETLFICKKCNTILSRNRFRHYNCPCGNKVTKISDTRSESLAYFDTKLRDFISQNYWLEYGIDYLLKRKNFQTLCGVQVLGHSGNLHEIDNIAESRSSNFRFFCECKTGAVKVSDVLILAGKMADIGCSRGYIFTMSQTVQKEIDHLGRSRNISIIPDVLEQQTSKLLTQIREE